MELKQRLDDILARWDLLEHPFYRAWRAGELPVESLQSYASEYGAFVRQLPVAWAAVGQEETVQEEHEHARLWDSFAACLETSVVEPAQLETKDLLKSFANASQGEATALGALYAFEAQQPQTTADKLDGLRLHYDVASAGETYFEVHANDQHEAVWLLDRMAELPPVEQDQAVEACEETAERLWDALSGVLPEKLDVTVA